MKGARLPVPVRVIVRTAKAPLPERDPTFCGKAEVAWSREKMHVIRHQGVAADQPCVRLAPNPHEQRMRFLTSKPRESILGAHGHQHDGRLADMDQNTLRRLSSLLPRMRRQERSCGCPNPSPWLVHTDTIKRRRNQGSRFLAGKGIIATSLDRNIGMEKRILMEWGDVAEGEGGHGSAVAQERSRNPTMPHDLERAAGY